MLFSGVALLLGGIFVRRLIGIVLIFLAMLAKLSDLHSRLARLEKAQNGST